MSAPRAFQHWLVEKHLEVMRLGVLAGHTMLQQSNDRHRTAALQAQANGQTLLGRAS